MLDNMNFAEIHPSPAELRLLKRASRSYVVHRDQIEPAWHMLGEYGFIDLVAVEGEQRVCAVANDRGKAFLQYSSHQKAADRKVGLRYWITTAIALAALIKSFWPELTLLWQLLTR